MMITVPSQYRKASIIVDSDVEESDWASDNAVEFEGSVASSVGPPSMATSPGDEYEDDETTYRKNYRRRRESGSKERTNCRRKKNAESIEAVLLFGNIGTLGSD